LNLKILLFLFFCFVLFYSCGFCFGISKNFRETNRKSENFNHLSAISESIGALGWIAVHPTPAPYIKEMSDAAQFYTNRVLKDYKEKDPNHASWVKQWLQVLNELQAYVKQYHTTGVTWNSTKKSATFDASRVSSTSLGSTSTTTTTTASSGGTAPPGGPLPPPPPPMPNFNELLADTPGSASQQQQQSRSTTDALFAAINKGGEITKHLRQVTDDQKTHKNPALRAGSTVPGAASSSNSNSIKSTGSSSNMMPNKPPVFELEDKKWKVEYHHKKHDIVIDQTDLKQTVYIYQCKECTITVKGKVNSIQVDTCSRVGLIFDDALSTIEFINSNMVQMQVLGKVPTVSIEKTDGCQVYLSKHSLETEIVSSKSSSMNVLVPDDNNEFHEQPVPEQFKTTFNQKTRKLHTTPTESV
jgi:adenylyl cyclase-associated protein